MSLENFPAFPAARIGLEPPTVAIVGGGASGLLTAAQLHRHRAPVRIVLVEERPRLGRGVAYDTTCDAHLLNVPAAGMSAYPDDPGHFTHWARTRRPEAHAGSFLPRRLYGEYLEWCLDQEIGEPRRRTTFTAVRGRVTGVAPGPDGVRLDLADGGTVWADTVVLALGNSAAPAREPAAAEPGGAVRDAWQAGALENLPPGRPVALVGTGLTAVDVIVSLDEAGFDGKIHAVSRRGLLPRAHQAVPPAVALLLTGGPGQPTSAPTSLSDERDGAWPRTARALVATLRAEVDRAAAAGRDWRTVVDGLRPHTQALWASLPEPERARLHRHALRYWEVHRHRMAPEIAERVDALRRSGRLEIIAGRVVSITPGLDGGADLALRPRRRMTGSSPGPADVVIEAGTVIRCTGPTERLASAGDPLLDGLFRRGDARPGPLGLGLDVDRDGRLVGEGGRPSDTLWAVGPLRRGALLETTSVPEIREQAAALARVLPDSVLAAQSGSTLEEAL
ncbi:MAG: hypothetical protein QOJ23_1876 [Actinomycetota bacterium]|nr:hypothetical protein [Actinomycetota bacterium]